MLDAGLKPGADMLSVALSLWRHGLSIVPLGGFGEKPPAWVAQRFGLGPEEAKHRWPKTPRYKWKKYQEERPTEAQIQKWWTQHPNSNIGIVTGPLYVVDADSEDSIAWVETNLPKTPWKVRTGKGMHFYYRNNNELRFRNEVNEVGKIDTRGWGGYVVSALSRHPDDRYYEPVIDYASGVETVDDLPELTAEDVTAITNKGRAQAPPGGNGNLSFDATRHKPKADGSPVERGGRNSATASLAGQYLQAGHSLHEVRRLLDGWNSTNPEPLSSEELDTVTASVAATHLRNNPFAVVTIAPAVQTPRPLPVVAPEPFPAHLLSPPGVLGEICEWITTTARRPQPMLSLVATLSLGGVLLGRRYTTTTMLRTNQYLVSIARTGAGKAHPRKCIKEIIEHLGLPELLGGERIASGAGLMSRVAETPNVVFQLDEMGKFLKAVQEEKHSSHMAQIITNFMTLHSCAGEVDYGTERANKKLQPTLTVEFPCVHIHGTTTAEIFETFASRDVVSGFLNRMLLVEAPNILPRARRIERRQIPEVVAEWFDIVRRFETERDGNLRGNTPYSPTVIHNSPDAEALFDEFSNVCDERADKANAAGGGLDALWVRAWEHAAKIALILALSEDPRARLVQEHHCQWATEFVLFVVKNMARMVEERVADSDFHSLVKQGYAVIRATGERGLTPSQLCRCNPFFKLRKRDREDVLEALTGSRQVSFMQVKTKGNKRMAYVAVEFVDDDDADSE